MCFNINESLGFIINQTSLKLKGELNRRFKAYEVTTEQWGVLNCLWERDNVSQKELSEHLLKDQPTMTRILDKLEAKGLITRQLNVQDRREFLIHLTAQGQNLQTYLIPLALEALERALGDVSPAEEQQLKYLLRKITHNLT
ncbi:MAG: MarR family transcriptional regulator [Peptococcaceae bacterium]|nr:MarR family transcriptional regulator [Peptococcaceae bacterium]